MGRPKTKTEEQKREQHQKYNADYDKKNTTRLNVKLNNTTDRDILDFLTSIPNKQGYIKDLIRLDMEGRNLRYELATDPDAEMEGRNLRYELTDSTDTPDDADTDDQDDTYDTDPDNASAPVSPSNE